MVRGREHIFTKLKLHVLADPAEGTFGLSQEVLKAHYQHIICFILQGTVNRVSPVLGTDFQALLKRKLPLQPLHVLGLPQRRPVAGRVGVVDHQHKPGVVFLQKLPDEGDAHRVDLAFVDEPGSTTGGVTPQAIADHPLQPSLDFGRCVLRRLAIVGQKLFAGVGPATRGIVEGVLGCRDLVAGAGKFRRQDRPEDRVHLVGPRPVPMVPRHGDHLGMAPEHPGEERQAAALDSEQEDGTVNGHIPEAAPVDPRIQHPIVSLPQIPREVQGFFYIHSHQAITSCSSHTIALSIMLRQLYFCSTS